MTDKAPHTTPQSRTLRIPKRWFVVAAILLFAAGCTEKSRNPLSPNIAGPIAGVSISVPALSSPLDGALVSVDDQPVRVTFGNGQSNGERPVLYNVRLSTDAEFSVVLHEATEIPADPSGQTSYQLPAGLDPDQMYYWQAQADDGANASEPSAPGSFEVYAPLEISPPEIRVPGASGSGTATTLVINAPAIGGTASNVRYELQVAEDQGFQNIAASLSGSISGSSVTIDVTTLLSSGQASAASATAQARSSLASGGLRGETRYHWRARISADGREGTVVGPWSARGTFVTPRNASELVAPSPARPTGGTRASSTRPDLVVRNPRVPQAFGRITIRYNVAADQDFRNVISSFSVPMASGATTSGRPSTLAKDKLYYWRVRAVAGDLRGPWSAPAKFRTPKGVSGGGGGGGGSGTASDELDLSQVVWLHTNISGWPQTSTITSVTVGAPPICIDHTKRGRWPAGDFSGSGAIVDSNVWVFAKIGGTWYAATWEWIRAGTTCKNFGASDFRTHVNGASPLSSWTPRSGERIGLMVSTPARLGPAGPVRERSNVVLRTWP